MCSAARQLADDCCGGKLVLVLEGGYHLNALARSVHACLEKMTGGGTDNFTGGVSAQTGGAIRESRDALRKFWPRVWWGH